MVAVPLPLRARTVAWALWSPNLARPGHIAEDRMTTAEATYIGIDGDKAELHIAVRPSGDTWDIPNNTHSIADLVSRLIPLHPTLVVLEATGGLEVPLAAAIAVAKLPVAVLNPRQVRDFAKATNRSLAGGGIARAGQAPAGAYSGEPCVVRERPVAAECPRRWSSGVDDPPGGAS